MRIEPVRTIYEWRDLVGPDRVRAFRETLVKLPGFARSPSLERRTGGDAHLALLHRNLFGHLILTGHKIRFKTNHLMLLDDSRDAGDLLVQRLADQGGRLKDSELEPPLREAAKTLAGRGVIFEQNGSWHLPAELILLACPTKPERGLARLTATLTSKTLKQIVPEKAQKAMTQPSPLACELGGWLLASATRALADFRPEDVSDRDWRVLLILEDMELIDWEDIEDLFDDAQPVFKRSYYPRNDSPIVDVRESLENHPPQHLRQLMASGLAALRLARAYNERTAILMPVETHQVLQRHLDARRTAYCDEIRNNWLAEQTPEAWYSGPFADDHALWRTWVAAHFHPPALTRQGNVRKQSLKQLAGVTRLEPDRIETVLHALHGAGLIEETGDGRLSCRVKNPDDLREHLMDFLWKSIGACTPGGCARADALDALAGPPTDVWLKRKHLAIWLSLSGTREDGTQWERWLGTMGWFHEISVDGECVRFPPLIRSLLQDKAPTLQAPGWRGLAEDAPVHAFIGADGAIRVPPECRAEAWRKLADFCELESVEQLITLRIDERALRRMSGDEAALKRARQALEALQSPLPQAVARMFESHAKTRAAARVAAGSLTLLVDDPTLLPKLARQGFTLHQPFPDRPEIAVLDGDDDPVALIEACREAGMPVRSLIEPKVWIDSQAGLREWARRRLNCGYRGSCPWIEAVVQRSRTAQPKRMIAGVNQVWGEDIEVVPMRRVRGKWKANKPVGMKLRHIVRLRELSDAEVDELGLA